MKSVSSIHASTKRTVMIRLRDIVSANFVWALVLSLSFVAFLIDPVFYSMSNLYNLLITFSVLGLLTLGESVVLLTGNFDNSIEATLVLSAMVAAWLTASHPFASGMQLPATVGILSTLLIGIIVGTVNGVLVAYVNMQPFITTFATSVIVAGMGTLMTGGAILTPYPAGYTTLGRSVIGPFPLSGVFVIGLYFIVHLVFQYTRAGRRLFVVGGNIDAAKSLGIDEKKTLVLAYIVAGLLAAFGGWILGGRLNSASSQMSSGQLLLAYGAAVIGGVRLGGGEAKVSSIFGGVVLIASIYTLMNIARIDPYIMTATTGTVILIAMLIDALRSGKFLISTN